MNHNNSDRNLLFGILALQLDFVRKDQLIEAMQAWVLDKSTPVAEHLIRAGALLPKHRQLLEPLVAVHVERCEQDPHTSISSEKAFATIREELKRIQDRDLEESVERVSARTYADQSASGRERHEASTILVADRVVVPTSSRYRILRPHAEGGLGQVFIAKDEELGREVALKEIKPSKADNTDNRARFTREAEITGGLEHPGIVPVYGLGVHADGRPYYAMRFIRGNSLKDEIQKYHVPIATTNSKTGRSQRNIDLRRLLQRFISVCETIDYAHSRGILHRDIKPSNIMLGRHGETLVVDWGLAKPLTGSARHGANLLSIIDREARIVSHPAEEMPEGPLAPTMSGSESMPTLDGSALGTPPFMSPEQASGRLDLLGPASDVFSLGATLFAILTGRAPYKAPTLSEILRLAQACSYPTPRSLNREIPVVIEAVCLKAMSERLEDRYPSAKALAEDIERFLADEPVMARKESLLERTGRFTRRNRSWVTAAAAILLITSISALTTTWLVHQARQAKELSDMRLLAASQKAKSQELLALTNQLTSRRIAKTQSWIDENCRDIDKAAKLAETDDVRLVLRNEVSAIECAADVRWQRTLLSDFDASRLAFDSKGKQLARGASHLNAGQVLLQILDPATGAIEKRLSFFADLAFVKSEKGADGIKALSYSPDDRYLFAGSRSGWIYQWSVPDYKLVNHWHAHSNWVNQFLFSADQPTFWTCSKDRTVKRWSLESGQQLAKYDHAEIIPSIGLSGTMLFVGGSQTALLEKDGLKLLKKEPSGITHCNSIAPLGRLDALAICQSKAIIIQPDVALSNPQSVFMQSVEDFHTGTIQGMRIDPNARWVATFDFDHFRTIDYASGSIIAQHSRGNTIHDVQFHPSEPLLYVSSGNDLEEYRIHSSPTLYCQHVGPFPIQAISLPPSGKQLCSISCTPGTEPSFSSLAISELPSTGAMRKLVLQTGVDLYLSSDGEAQRIYVADESNGKIFEIDSANMAVQLHSGNESPKLVSCSPQNGQCLFASRARKEFGPFVKAGPFQLSRLVAPDQPAVSLWKNQLSNLTLQRSDLFALAVHENLAAFTSHDNHVRLLNTETGELLWDYLYSDAMCNAIALTTDHQRLIVGDSIGKLHVFFPQSKREPVRLQAHQESIAAICVSESGRLISGSNDRWIKLWQLQEYGVDPICEMGPFPNSIAQLKLSQDGSLCAILFHKSRAVHMLQIDELLEKFRSQQLLPSSGN